MIGSLHCECYKRGSMNITFDEARETGFGIMSPCRYARKLRRKFIFRDGRLYVQLGRLWLRIVYQRVS